MCLMDRHLPNVTERSLSAPFVDQVEWEDFTISDYHVRSVIPEHANEELPLSFFEVGLLRSGPLQISPWESSVL